MQNISPEKLFFIIVIGVSIGIGLSPYIGTIGIVIGTLAIVVVVASWSFKALKIAFKQLPKLHTLIRSEITLYKRSFINAWVLLTSKNTSSMFARLNGLWVLITFLVWLGIITLLFTLLVIGLLKH